MKGLGFSMGTQLISRATVTPITEPLHDVTAERLRRAIRAHIRNGERSHILDLRPLARLDSPTLAALIRVLRLVREVGGSVALVVNQPHFLRILSITGLDRVFPVWPDDGAALASFGLTDVVPA